MCHGALEIVVSPDTEPVLNEVLEQDSKVPFSLTVDPDLLSGQVCLRSKTGECEINLDALLLELTTAIDTFFEVNKQENQNG